jgi:hypothetical protein
MFTSIIIFILFFSVFLGIIFLGLDYYSSGKAYGEERKTKIGKRLMILPFGIVAAYILLFFLYQKIAFKPNEQDVIGSYEISEASNVGIEKKEFPQYNLELRKNGEFYFNNMPDIDICATGRYTIYDAEDGTGIRFDCLGNNGSAEIVSSLRSFKIEFNIGDPDSGERICYKKIEK